MKSTIFIFIFVLAFGVSGCSFMSQRSYSDVMENSEEGMFIPNRDFPVVAGDSGEANLSRREILRRIPASRLEKEKIFENFALEEELAQLESEQSSSMAEHYERYRDRLKTNSEKILNWLILDNFL